MNTPATSQGWDGGRPSAASGTPPLSYRRAPVRLLRNLPIRENPRLDVLDFRLTTAPGMRPTLKPRTYGHGTARLAGFVLDLCVVRVGDQWYFETSAAPWDEVADRREGMEFSWEVLADIYRAVQRRISAAEGRAYGRGEGRN